MINAGIDKIKLLLNPYILNPEMPKHIRADNALTLHKAGCYTLLAIHAEYYEPLVDYRLKIAQAIYELIEKKVILFPNENPFFTCGFILSYLECFILGVSEVEFFFDFMIGKVSINEEAIKNGDIKQYDVNGSLTETFYSNDGDSRNIFCVYNKRDKLLHDRHISKKEIDDSGVGYKIEARLRRENCPYLTLSNLTGTYEDIFKRFQSFLGVKYFTYLFPYIEVKDKANTHHTRLVRCAKKGKTKFFNRGKLMESEPVHEIAKNEEEIEAEKEAVLGKYYQHIENTETPTDTGMDSNEMACLVD
jgi:hypothetical protein